MEIGELTKPMLKLILQTSEGFPTPRMGNPAFRISTDAATGARSVAPKPSGHALHSHVRGADAITDKTKFCSVDDQVEALWLLLNTPAGMQKLRTLQAGGRQVVKEEIGRVFPVQVTVPGRGSVTFTTAELNHVGVLRTRCVAVLDGRDRAGRLHLHVQTCYPELDDARISQLVSNRGAR